MTRLSARRAGISLLALSASLSVTASGLAQGTDGAADDGIDTITVTAQFREQSVLEVPLAVTAYEGEFLNGIGVDEFDELSAFVPGFTVQEQSVNNPGFVLRGITSDDGASTIEPRVSVFQNGVSISRSRGSVVPFFDLERVEVLNGPQGTLFGRSAQIGAVHIITNKPTSEFAGGASAMGGNFDQQRYDAFVNIPIAEDLLSFRAAAYYERRAGYVDNNTGRDLNGVDTFAARGSLRFTPTEDFTVDVIGHYVDNAPTGTSFKSGVIPALGGDTNPNSFASLNTFGNFKDGRDISVDREIFDITGIINWQINDRFAVTSTTAYREFDSSEVFDPDGTALDLLIFAEDAEAEQFSSDIRFSYDDGNKFTGFFGGGVFIEEGSQAVPLGFELGTFQLFSTFGAIPDPVIPGADVPLPGSVDPLVLGALLTGNPAVFPPTGIFQQETVINFADNVSFDIFGEVTYEVLPNLEFTAGGRFTYDDKESLFASFVDQPNPILLGTLEQLTNGGRAAFGLPPVQVISAFAGFGQDGLLSSNDQAGLDTTFSGFAWRAVLNYEFQPNRFVYFNYSRGRRPDVIDENFDRDANDLDFDGVVGDIIGEFTVVPAETVNSYEVGLKGDFLDDRVTFQAAAYYYGYSNFQTSIAVNEPGQAPAFDLINAGNASSYGVEFSTMAELCEELDLFFTYGYNQSRFDETDNDGNVQQFADNRFRLAPDHALSVGLNYRKAFGGDKAFFLRPTYTWQSEVFFTNDNDIAFDVVDPVSGGTIFTVPGIREDSYGLLNINGGVELMEGQVVLQGYVKNLLDKDYIIDAGNTGGSFQIPTFIVGQPRFFGGGVQFRF